MTNELLNQDKLDKGFQKVHQRESFHIQVCAIPIFIPGTDSFSLESDGTQVESIRTFHYSLKVGTLSNLLVSDTETPKLRRIALSKQVRPFLWAVMESSDDGCWQDPTRSEQLNWLDLSTFFSHERRYFRLRNETQRETKRVRDWDDLFISVVGVQSWSFSWTWKSLKSS